MKVLGSEFAIHNGGPPSGPPGLRVAQSSCLSNSAVFALNNSSIINTRPRTPYTKDSRVPTPGTLRYRLWNRRFHPFNACTETKRREKLNDAERHKLWHGRPARDHGRDGRATKGCAIIQVALYRCTITRSGAASRVRLGIGRCRAGGITT